MRSPQDLALTLAEWAHSLTGEELRQALEFLGLEYRDRLRRANQLAAMTFHPGEAVESVKAGRKLPAGARGQVIAVRGGAVRVCFPEHGGEWRMPATLLKRVEGDEFPPGGPGG